MERMTGRNQYGAYVELNKYSDLSAIERLADYEDIGLTPEEIKPYWALFDFANEHPETTYGRLEEILNAEKESRLVVLPCKVGDTVYRIEYIWNETNHAGYVIGVAEKKFNFLMLGEFGMTVFLTREEAESALAKED